MPTGPRIFATASHWFTPVRCPHYKTTLYHILTWRGAGSQTGFLSPHILNDVTSLIKKIVWVNRINKNKFKKMQKLPEAPDWKLGDVCPKKKGTVPTKRRDSLSFQQEPADWMGVFFTRLLARLHAYLPSHRGLRMRVVSAASEPTHRNKQHKNTTGKKNPPNLDLLTTGDD